MLQCQKLYFLHLLTFLSLPLTHERTCAWSMNNPSNAGQLSWPRARWRSWKEPSNWRRSGQFAAGTCFWHLRVSALRARARETSICQKREWGRLRGVVGVAVTRRSSLVPSTEPLARIVRSVLGKFCTRSRPLAVLA